MAFQFDSFCSTGDGGEEERKDVSGREKREFTSALLKIGRKERSVR